jgi:hypothetical protein
MPWLGLLKDSFFSRTIHWELGSSASSHEAGLLYLTVIGLSAIRKYSLLEHRNYSRSRDTTRRAMLSL